MSSPVTVFGANGSSKKGFLVKDYKKKENGLGSFLVVRFSNGTKADPNVSLFFLPAQECEGFWNHDVWRKAAASRTYTVVGSGAVAQLSSLRCILFGELKESDAEKMVNEMTSWYERRTDFLEKLHNGQVCYTREDAAAAKRRGYTVFVKNDFGAGGYYEKPENIKS